MVGTPQADYYLVASPDVAAAMGTWTPVPGSTNTLNNLSGLWQFTVTNTAPQQFYHAAAVTPCPQSFARLGFRARHTAPDFYPDHAACRAAQPGSHAPWSADIPVGSLRCLFLWSTGKTLLPARLR